MTWVDVTIAEVVQETEVDRSFVLAVPPEHRTALRFAPGQYVRLRDPRDATRRDWYFSLSGAPNEEGTLRITVRGTGAYVQPVYGARRGMIWRAAPPAGAFLITAPETGRVVLVAAGSGVTPFRAFLEHQAATDGDTPICLLQSARSAGELVFLEEFRAWSATRASFLYVPTVTGPDGGWGGRMGRIDARLLAEAVDAPDAARLFACGPRGFVDDMLELATGLGLAPAQVCGEGH